MSYTHRILSAMKIGREYTTSEIEALTRIPRDEVRRVMNLLISGGVLEKISEEKVERKKETKVKSKQPRLFP